MILLCYVDEEVRMVVHWWTRLGRVLLSVSGFSEFITILGLRLSSSFFFFRTRLRQINTYSLFSETSTRPVGILQQLEVSDPGVRMDRQNIQQRQLSPI